MKFNEFIPLLEKEMGSPLPGEESQYKMAPFERPLKEEAMKLDPNPKLSAVLCLFYPSSNQTYFPLIIRNSYKGVHSAQVAFPGGKKEKEDNDLMQTALRETQEEIGVFANDITILGQLSEVYIPPSGYLVQPYVGFITSKPDFIPEESEVAGIIEAPLNLFMDEKIVKHKTIKLSARNTTVKAPSFQIDQQTVWGATAMMLGEMKDIIARFYK